MSSALQQALDSFNSAQLSRQESSDFFIDDNLRSIAEQKRSELLAKKEQTQEVLTTMGAMALHHFGGKLLELMEKVLTSDGGAGKIMKKPADADEGTEMTERETGVDDTDPEDVEAPAPPPDVAATGAPPPRTDDVDEEDDQPAVDTDAGASAEADVGETALPTRFSEFENMGGVQSADDAGRQLSEDLDEHFYDSNEFALANRVDAGTATTDEVISKLQAQNEDLFDSAQPEGTSANAQDLLRRVNNYKTQQSEGETTDAPAGGDPVPPPAPPVPSAGAGAAEAEAGAEISVADVADLALL